MRVEETDILIIGAGSGGFGAAWRAALLAPSARIVVVERLGSFGGNSTNGGVNTWEPGVAGLGAHRALYERLRVRPGAIAVGATTHFYRPEAPYGFSDIDPQASYESSLYRAGRRVEELRRVHFEPEAMAAGMEAMLRETGRVAIRYGHELAEVRTDGRLIREAVLRNMGSGERFAVRAKTYIDCSGGVALCRLAGCRTARGEESAAAYGEPNAPDTASPVVNGVTLMARATRRPAGEGAAGTVSAAGAIEVAGTGATGTADVAGPAATEPEMRAAAQRWLEERSRAVQINRYPQGDLNVNILPVMDGNEFARLPYERAMAICRARVIVYWEWFAPRCGFADYRLSRLFQLAGIRESERLVGRFVLREQDVRAGMPLPAERSRIIAYADHALDTHGRTNVKSGNLRELSRPYGIPFDALLPVEFDNVLAATRGSSFSHIAASSCRLSRTMMDLGEAAGAAAALAHEAGGHAGDAATADIRSALRLPEYEAWIEREGNGAARSPKQKGSER